jgi:hypothetical protein
MQLTLLFIYHIELYIDPINLKRQQESERQTNVQENNMNSAPSDNHVQENETQTGVSISNGNVSQLLHTPLFFGANGLFPSMQIL